MKCPECLQKVDPETVLCPYCGEEANFPAPSGHVCDLFLMGFSDPYSCDPVIDYLMQRSFWSSREELIPRISQLPALLAKDMASDRAVLLRKRLEEMGAIIELRERRMADRGIAKKIGGENDRESSPSPIPDTGMRGGKGYLVLSLFFLTVGAYLFYHHGLGQGGKAVQKVFQRFRAPSGANPEKVRIRSSKAPAVANVQASPGKDPQGVRLNNQGVSLLKEERYPEAIRLFQKALERMPEDSTILLNLHRAWLQVGYRALDDKDYEGAILALEKAVSVLDQSPEAYKVMGMAALKVPDESRAERYFRLYLDRVPDDPEVARILGELLYKQNRLEEGIAFLKIYLAANPSDIRIRKILEKAGREARAEKDFEWHEGKHFDVHFNGLQDTEAGYLVSELLEDAYRKIGAELNYYPPERMITILYSDEDFRNVTRSPDWAGGLYDGKIRIPIGGIKDRTSVLERVVMHEYAHALIHQMTGGRCPAWLNEGIAQYFEGASEEERAGTVVALLKTKNLIPFRELENSFLGMAADAATVAYAESLSVVDWMVEEHGIYTVQKLLAELGQGADIHSALERALGLDYSTLQDEWMSYLEKKYAVK